MAERDAAPPREVILGANIITLSICYQHLSAKFNRILEPLQLNMTQLSILTHFSRMPAGHAETVTHLSQVMEMNQPMVTKSIKAMHALGLIKKKTGKDDARVSFLYISEAGSARLQEAQQACLPLIEEAFADLSFEELTQLLGLLAKLKGRMV